MELNKEINQVSALNMADYILVQCGSMSHLKLQKLLYYCEAYHLAYTDRAVLHENFQAWVHGPVCVEVYHALKGNAVLYGDVSYDGAGSGSNPVSYIKDALASKQIEIIDDVLSSLSSWKDSELEASTHREFPWIEARSGKGPSEKHDGIINKVTMSAFYKKELLKDGN